MQTNLNIEEDAKYKKHKNTDSIGKIAHNAATGLVRHSASCDTSIYYLLRNNSNNKIFNDPV